METRLKKSTVCLLVLVSCLIFGLIASYRMTFALDKGTNSPVNVVKQEEQKEKEKVVRARGDIKPPKVIKKVEPEYPEESRKEGIDGVVILESTTDKYGVVQEVKVLRSIPTLDKAAIDALKQWIFEPMVIDGEPVGVIFTVTIQFKLDDEKRDKGKKKGIVGGVIGGVQGGVEGGVEAEVVGGVQGGVEGGVIGGVEGGVISGIQGEIERGVTGGIQGEIEQGILILDEEDEKPKLIKKVEAVYPDSAKKKGIKGVVNVQVTIDIYGLVEVVKILKSIPELNDAAVQAVKQWVYEPYLVDGKPVKVAFKVTIVFKLK